MTIEERVLLLPATAADANLSRSILAEAGLDCRICRDFGEIADCMAEGGGGVILLTDELLPRLPTGALLEALATQPPWSDIPVVLLSAEGAAPGRSSWALEMLGNVTVLERPVRVTTLVSALRAAIRARLRQYELRRRMRDLTLAEASLRQQTERLRLLWETGSVMLQTDDPDEMLHTVFQRIAPHFRLSLYFHAMANEARTGFKLSTWHGIDEQTATRIAGLQHAALAARFDAEIRLHADVGNLQTSEEIASELARAGLEAYVCHPLVAEGRLLGTLSFAGLGRGPFDADEIEFLGTICRYLTVAYLRARLIHQLRDTDRRKDEFLATLAHELRNPLAPLRNALQIIRLAQGDESTVEKARAMMDRQLHQMVRLIDDLLDVSRISRGKLALRKEAVELAGCIRNAVETARPLIEAAGHSLTLDLPDTPVWVNADPVRLAQVFSNLLNNAAKFTERGGRIWLEAVREQSQAVVEVRDNGIGIPASELPHIFDMFTQGDQSLEKSHGGLGIGLTLVKRLVEMHGGSVRATSEGTGHGAQFTVTLPMAVVLPKRMEKGEPMQTPAAFAGRVLVADDNHDAAESLSVVLRLMGSEVRTVHDGQQAVEEAALFHPDVILLDIGMPRLNGYEAARRIRREDWSARTVLVALTGWGQEEDKRRATEAGFDWHFTKPVNTAELHALMSGLRAETGAAGHKLKG
jgi:signal transduction histidine kinase/ActR/RegA family two-component response regulator